MGKITISLLLIPSILFLVNYAVKKMLKKEKVVPPPPPGEWSSTPE